MNELVQHLSKIKAPLGGERVYKDECLLSYNSPESDNGLYVCLNKFYGFGHDYVLKYYQSTGNAVFLHIKRTKTVIPQTSGDVEPEKKVTRLALGVEGGFELKAGPEYQCSDENSIVILPNFTTIPLPDTSLPEMVQLSIASILAAESATKLDEMQGVAGTWDGEVRQVSKHTETLVQLDNGVKIPPHGWVCRNCDKSDNLWLNLTDGSILCGRRYHDGSGGNNHAVEHYHNTGYPLAVKLGTITPDGKADVYSYDEDDMVDDPLLAKHLQHFGINVANMEKTDKSMVELEIDLNSRVGEWATIQEEGQPLKPVYGPGYTGMANLGNSCYLNSVMQVVFTIPDFKKRFVDQSEKIVDKTLRSGMDCSSDFNTQICKLGVGLLSGKYSRPSCNDSGQEGIRPTMFKSVIGHGHREFSTKRQQDAQEFLLHLINMMEKHSQGQVNPAECFKFRVEDRFQCNKSKKVKYRERAEYVLPLPVPLEAAVNKEEVVVYEGRRAEARAKGLKWQNEEVVRPKISFQSCLDKFTQAETIDQFFSTALNEKTTAYKTCRLSTFPDYLMVQLKKFTMDDNWVPQKLDVSVDVPDVIDLAALRGTGLTEGEEELPEPQENVPEPQLNMALVGQLSEMGFPLEACKKATYFSQDQGIEAAMNWIMAHMGDSDFEDPFVVPGLTPKGSGSFVVNEEAVSMVSMMGFTREQATRALRETSNNVERAVDWIFSHREDLSNEESPMQPQFRDGSEKYKLVAFISHMGTSTMVGHYVCHILKEGRWVIFNDNKVAESANPPRDLGYLYLYQRLVE